MARVRRRVAGVGYVPPNRNPGRRGGGIIKRFGAKVAHALSAAVIYSLSAAARGTQFLRNGWRQQGADNLPLQDVNADNQEARPACHNPLARRRGPRNNGNTDDEENMDIPLADTDPVDGLDQDDETTAARTGRRQQASSTTQRRGTTVRAGMKTRSGRRVVGARTTVRRKNVKSQKKKSNENTEKKDKMDKAEMKEDFLRRMEARNKQSIDPKVFEHLVKLAKDPIRRKELFPKIPKDKTSTLWHIQNQLAYMEVFIKKKKATSKFGARKRTMKKEEREKIAKDGKRMEKLIVNDFSSEAPLEYTELSPKIFMEGTANVKFIDATTKQQSSKKAFKPPYVHAGKTVDAANYRKDKNWKEGKEFKISCQCKGGCKLESCPCMQASVAVNNRVVESRKTADNELHAIVECGEHCDCCQNGSCSASKIQFKQKDIHIVLQNEMGFGFRALEPFQTGDPIVTFTGIRQAGVDDKEKFYAYTTANFDAVIGPAAWMRKLSGIKDRKARSFFINPKKFGNCGSMMCHSKWANAAFINIYRGGMKYTDPECCIYAKEPIEAGQFVYLNYGKEYDEEYIEKCRCTQLLCNPDVIDYLRSIGPKAAVALLVKRLENKQARMRKLEKAVLAAADRRSRGSR